MYTWPAGSGSWVLNNSAFGIPYGYSCTFNMAVPMSTEKLPPTFKLNYWKDEKFLCPICDSCLKEQDDDDLAVLRWCCNICGLKLTYLQLIHWKAKMKAEKK